jgi:thiamine biosynthesis lipoprotein ApbE
MHHLVDPGTALPAASDLAQVTAIAATTEDADVLAKCAFLLGATRGPRFLHEHGAAGVVVHRGGAVELVGELEVEHA